MATTLGNLVVNLRANTASFIKSMDQSRTKSTALGVAIGAMGAQIGAAFLRMGKQAAVALPNLILGSIKAADQMAKLSQGVGVSVEALSGLGFAAKLSGGDIETLGKGLKNLAGRALDVKQGLTESKRTFKALGISVLDVNGKMKDTDVILLEVADRFKDMKDGTEKTALAMELFGKAGVTLIPLLNQGAAGIKGMTDEARELGQVLSTKMAKASEEFNDNLQRLRDAVSGVGNTIAKDLLPQLVQLTDKTVAWVKEAKLAAEAAGTITRLFQAGVGSARALGRAYDAMGKPIRNFGATALLVMEGDFKSAMIAGGQAVEDFNRIATTNIFAINSVIAEMPEKARKSVAELADIFIKTAGFFTELGTSLAAQNVGQAETEAIKARIAVIRQEMERLKESMSFPVRSFFIDLDEASKLAVAPRITAIRLEVEELRHQLSFGAPRDFMIDLSEASKLATIDVGEVRKVADETAQAFENMALVVGTAFEDAILSGKGLRDILSGILNDIARIILRSTVTKPLQGILAGIGKTIGAFFGVPVFDKGGFPEVGKLAIVGGRGPELFVPKVSGQIVPAGAFGGGQNVTIHNTIQVFGDPDPKILRKIRAFVQDSFTQSVITSVGASRELRRRTT